jgi:glutamine amidotransferase
MCRLLGSVSREPRSLRNELIGSDCALVTPDGGGDSGWGMAAYTRADGEEPRCFSFPDVAVANGYESAADTKGRILMAHVRKATRGALTDSNTHPFCLAEYAFCHNGTLSTHERLLGLPDGRGPLGDTDSERFFHRLLREVDPDPDRVVEGLRRAVTAVTKCGPISGANFLFSDGERLYAYRLGLFELHWLARPGQVVVSSHRVTDEQWHDVRQDVLLILSPREDEPHAERLVGDEVLATVRLNSFDDGSVPALAAS